MIFYVSCIVCSVEVVLELTVIGFLIYGESSCTNFEVFLIRVLYFLQRI